MCAKCARWLCRGSRPNGAPATERCEKWPAGRPGPIEPPMVNVEELGFEHTWTDLYTYIFLSSPLSI